MLYTLALLLLSFSSFAQKSNIDRSGTLVWLGINYTLLTFDGDATQFKDAGELSNSDLRNKYFPAWNALIAREPEKYSLSAATGFSDWSDKSELSEDLNSGSKADFFGRKSDHVAESDITNAIKKYNFKGLSGTGLVFFVTYMNKITVVENVWVAYVSLPSGAVQQIKKYEEKPGGFGFRNYWAKPLSLVLKSMGKSKR